MRLSTGLGQAFTGMLLLALATSLPELSTTIAASRTGRYHHGDGERLRE